MYAAADSTWGLSETAALRRVIGTQEPLSPTTPHPTPPIHPPESSILDTVPPSSIKANSGINACYGLAAVLPSHGPLMMMSAGNSNACQQRPMPREITQAPISGNYFVGAKGAGGPMALGTSGHTIGVSQMTMHWLRAGTIWVQVQVLVTDQIHNSYVHSLMKHFQIRDLPSAEWHRCGQQICDWTFTP